MFAERIFSWLAALLAVVLLGTPAAKADPFAAASKPGPGVLLLRNGQTLEGQIVRSGDTYRLMLTDGEVRIKAADVEFCCRDLERGYRLKRQTIQHGNIHDHLRLARWCIHNNLLGHAGTELAEAIAADPEHPLIDLLSRQLEAARRPRAAARQSPSTLAANEPRPSLDDLERLAQGLTDEAVETFTRTIQPLLVNHCGSTACHGERSASDFRLQSFPMDRPALRRTTLRNLHAVLGRVDRENPEASPLLNVPLDTHGTAATPIFPRQQDRQYQRLAAWVGQLTDARPQGAAQAVAAKRPPSGSFLFPWQRTAPPLLPKAATERSQPMQPTQPATSAVPVADVTPAAHEEPVVAAEDASQDEPALQRGRTVQRGGRLKVFTPADPFDPAIFNRRYFGPDETPR